MKEVIIEPELFRAVTELYATMEREYDEVARQLGHTCMECPDNCCDSYFQHYTYLEWAYFWQGIRSLDDALLDRLLTRAREWVEESHRLLEQGIRPQLMCPCNEDGLCVVYPHRMMICRLHGIPATMTRPDGQMLRFPGCWRCQEIVSAKYENEADAPSMDRTGLFRQFARLESELLGDKRHLYPKLKMTIAEMIVAGPPRVPTPHCEK